MNLLSKEASVEKSIENMQNVLNKLNHTLIYSKEKHPLQNCYSINIALQDLPNYIYSNGKGIISKASMASALGEYIERLQTNNFFIDFALPNRNYYDDQVLSHFNSNYLNKKLLNFYDPHSELTIEDLVDFNSNIQDKIVCLPFKNCSNDEIINFPLNILSNLYVSNGLASGNTPKEAQVQSLSEIIERYVKIQIIKNAYSLPSYPTKVLEKFPTLNDDIHTLQELGFIVEVLDASLGGVFPVTAISLINPHNNTLFVSFGSHPLLEVSLQRTLSELMQGRDIENLDDFQTPTFDTIEIASSSNIESHFIDSNGKMGFEFLNKHKSFEYQPWGYNGNSCDEEYWYLFNILHTMKKDIYLREYNHLGFYSCQIIVPSISEIYPVDDLIYNNKNNGKHHRDMIINFKQYDPQEIINEISNLEDIMKLNDYIGVIFKENYTMLEFKIQIYLLLEEYQEVYNLALYSQNKLCIVIKELLSLELRELEYEDYEEGLFNIFSKEMVLKAIDIIQNKAYLIDTTMDKQYLALLKIYDALPQKK